MPIAELVTLTIFLTLAALDGLAIWRVFRSPFYTGSQRLGQIVFVLLIPILGALLVLYLVRSNPPGSSGQYPIEHNDAQDIAFSNNYDYGAQDANHDVGSHD